MNKQVIVKLDATDLTSFNKFLEEGYQVGQQFHFTNGDILVVLNKFIPHQNQAGYNPYTLGGY